MIRSCTRTRDYICTIFSAVSSASSSGFYFAFLVAFSFACLLVCLLLCCFLCQLLSFRHFRKLFLLCSLFVAASSASSLPSLLLSATSASRFCSEVHVARPSSRVTGILTTMNLIVLKILKGEKIQFLVERSDPPGRRACWKVAIVLLGTKSG